MFRVSGSSKLCCTGRLLLKYLPQDTLYSKRLFSESSCEVVLVCVARFWSQESTGVASVGRC